MQIYHVALLVTTEIDFSPLNNFLAHQAIQNLVRHIISYLILFFNFGRLQNCDLQLKFNFSMLLPLKFGAKSKLEKKKQE